MRADSHDTGLGVPVCMHGIGTATKGYGQEERRVLGLLPFLLALPEIPLRDLILVALTGALLDAEASLGTLMLPAVAGSLEAMP